MAKSKESKEVARDGEVARNEMVELAVRLLQKIDDKKLKGMVCVFNEGSKEGITTVNTDAKDVLFILITTFLRRRADSEGDVGGVDIMEIVETVVVAFQEEGMLSLLSEAALLAQGEDDIGTRPTIQ